MRHRLTGIAMASAVLALLAGPAGAAAPPGGLITTCPPDAVVSGTTCMDKYEASVWRVPDPTTTNAGLVRRIQLGRATQADLTAGGATQLGTFGTDDYSPCADSGQNCANDIYAVSLPGVMPSANLTWFQALAACTNARKRLPSNAEWQAAVAGTPDPGPDNGTTDCNTQKSVALPTGSRSDCVSSAGAFDMVGNVEEYVADWVPPPTTLCSSWTSGISPTQDAQCLTGAAETGEPGVLTRGGNFNTGLFGGPVAVISVRPSISFDIIGFRCAR
jgi:formylglycine-generating enzyme required for sulfatase activity